MAEPESATKAPESDLHEEPIDDDKAPLSSKSEVVAALELESQPMSEPQSSPSDSKPTLSEHCTTSQPLPSSITEAPSGDLTKWTIATPSSPTTEIEVYISKPADYPTTPSRLLLFLTNGSGINSLNNQHQADLFARAGYLTIMPDMFAGDPAPNTKPAESDLEADASWLDTVKLKVAETAKSFGLDMWLARQTPEKVLPILQGVLKQAKDEFADAVSHGGGIYAVGYCFGGRYVLILAGERADSVMQGQDVQDKAEQGQVMKGPEIKTGICAHGTLVGREELKGIKAPIQLVCVEDDPLFPQDVLDEGRKWLQESGVDHEIEVYKNVPHGKFSMCSGL